MEKSPVVGILWTAVFTSLLRTKAETRSSLQSRLFPIGSECDPSAFLFGKEGLHSDLLSCLGLGCVSWCPLQYVWPTKIQALSYQRWTHAGSSILLVSDSENFLSS